MDLPIRRRDGVRRARRSRPRRRRTWPSARLGVLQQRVSDLAAVRSSVDADDRRTARSGATGCAAAVDYRRTLGIDDTAWRLVHGEADRLPGLVVDRYGDVLVVQTLAQGTDRRLAELTAVLVELVQPRGILARNDPKVRRLEGLDEQVRGGLRRGAATVIEVTEGRDPPPGGRPPRPEDRACSSISARTTRRRRPYARGRALDAFTYHGGFALQMARRCESVLAIDSSAAAVAATRASGDPQRPHERRGSRSQRLRRAARARDRRNSGSRPSCWIRRRSPRTRPPSTRAAAGYKEINLRALKLLEPGGHLVTCSCSYNIGEEHVPGHRRARPRSTRARR